MNLSELTAQADPRALKMAQQMGMEEPGPPRKQDIIFAISRRTPGTARTSTATACSEILQDGFGFLRSPEGRTSRGRTHLHQPSQIRRFKPGAPGRLDLRLIVPEGGERLPCAAEGRADNFDSPDNARSKCCSRT